MSVKRGSGSIFFLKNAVLGLLRLGLFRVRFRLSVNPNP